jgi:hypothetical protein
MSVRLTVEHSYSKKMLESGDNQIKKKGFSERSPEELGSRDREGKEHMERWCGAVPG